MNPDQDTTSYFSLKFEFLSMGLMIKWLFMIKRFIVGLLLQVSYYKFQA